MAQKNSHPVSTHDMQMLKSYIHQLDSTLKHLDSVVGAHMKAMDKALSKINGKKLKKLPQSRQLEHIATAQRDKAFSSILRSLGGAAGGNSLMGSSSSSLSGSSRMSSGQIWTEMATSIARAMSRNT